MNADMDKIEDLNRKVVVEDVVPGLNESPSVKLNNEISPAVQRFIDKHSREITLGS